MISHFGGNLELILALAYVSMQRIEHFLGENEVPDWASVLKTAERNTSQYAYEDVGFERASFEWHTGTSKSALSPTRFQLGPFRLIFFGDLDIMVLIHIDDMQPGFEKVED